MLIEARAPLRIRLPERELFLVPGQQVDLPDKHALQLLEKVGTKVRRLSPDTDEAIVIEPASPAARLIYWESTEGTWHGPVKPEYLGRTGSGPNEQFWVIVNHKGSIWWIWADLLRSRQAFLAGERKRT